MSAHWWARLGFGTAGCKTQVGSRAGASTQMGEVRLLFGFLFGLGGHGPGAGTLTVGKLLALIG